ncbi:MAG: M23 family metallopeptidase [Gemmatimonadota bacterium]|nr:M23 family metallopeptidase [Gemmatimonadota bacterium]
MKNAVRRERRRAWTLILVPPRPGARTRQLTIRARTVGVLGSVLFVVVASAATWTRETTFIAASSAGKLAESQRMVVGLLDSVDALGALVAQERAARLPPRNMVMPVSGRISSRFATSRMHPILDIFRAHKGVDVAAPHGTRIIAPAAGRVRYVGWRVGYGLTIELEHSGGVVSRLAHCGKSLVKVGQRVALGTPVATVGATGVATGPHVHFEVLTLGRSVDPIKFLASSRGVVANETRTAKNE